MGWEKHPRHGRSRGEEWPNGACAVGSSAPAGPELKKLGLI